ncbi:hypothetical protein CDAR_396941 [Caerostris darwini]|uniref:Uncharacterized protein n=1 Tax=Caerostris darwini TaxID=1538125 RepID=A0AAV4Q6J8_9ARAC|nr:hypothetical protein CDAR_396941 [Caerostris darwini]
MELCSRTSLRLSFARFRTYPSDLTLRFKPTLLFRKLDAHSTRRFDTLGLRPAKLINPQQLTPGSRIICYKAAAQLKRGPETSAETSAGDEFGCQLFQPSLHFSFIATCCGHLAIPLFGLPRNRLLLGEMSGADRKNVCVLVCRTSKRMKNAPGGFGKLERIVLAGRALSTILFAKGTVKKR